MVLELIRNTVLLPNFLPVKFTRISVTRFGKFDTSYISFADMNTQQWSFLVFFGIFELGSVLCGAAISSVMLIIGRAIAGFGGSYDTILKHNQH